MFLVQTYHLWPHQYTLVFQQFYYLYNHIVKVLLQYQHLNSQRIYFDYRVLGWLSYHHHQYYHQIYHYFILFI